MSAPAEVRERPSYVRILRELFLALQETRLSVQEQIEVKETAVWSPAGRVYEVSVAARFRRRGLTGTLVLMPLPWERRKVNRIFERAHDSLCEEPSTPPPQEVYVDSKLVKEKRPNGNVDEYYMVTLVFRVADSAISGLLGRAELCYKFGPNSIQGFL